MGFEPLQVPEEQTPQLDAPPEGGVVFEPLPEVSTVSPAGGAFDQGYQAGVELASEQAKALASAFAAAEQARADQALAQASRLEAEAASLACQIASSLVDSELSLRPELVLSVVQGALSDIADASEAVVELHPEDLALVEGPLASGEIKLTFRPDPSLTRGGCKVHSSVGDVDATREGRLSRMQARIEEITRERQ